MEPVFRQIFVGRGAAVPDRAAFERKLYVIRKRAEHAMRGSELAERKFFYLASLSANTLIYKGMLSADQIETMFPDVTDPLDDALAEGLLGRIAGEEHDTGTVMPGRGQGDAEALTLAGEEGMRHLDQDAGAVAGVDLAAAGAAVEEVLQDREGLAHDRV